MAALDLARGYAGGALSLALVTIDDLLAQTGERTTLAGGWNGGIRRIPLPEGGTAEARLRDGGNCFNVNSLVTAGESGLAANRTGVEQFFGLMLALQVPQGEARRIAEGAADWVDSDEVAGFGGAEDSAYLSGQQPYRTANGLVADPTELRAVAGMTPDIYARLQPFLCALPLPGLSPINVNTILPDQAPLIAMLAQGRLDVARAQRVIAQRPPNGWASEFDFFLNETISEAGIGQGTAFVRMKTEWFALDIRVEQGGAEFLQSALVDARRPPARVAAVRWGAD
jgi:general secretion pathway protein K